MARILNSGNNYGTNTNLERRRDAMGDNSRADKELNIALESKKYLDSYFTTLNDASTMLTRYYSQDIGETTSSEVLNMIKDSKTTKKFNKINKFIVWGNKNKDEIEQEVKDDRETSINLSQQEFVVLQGTIKPIEGDHIVFYSQGAQAKPYQVINVKPSNLIDKPVYIVTVSFSNSFTIETLEENVRFEFDFIQSNIGTQRKTMLLKNTHKRIKELNTTIIKLNNMYTEAFYDETYDALRYLAKNTDGSVKYYYMCRSLMEFQERHQVLTYSSNMNVLFSSYPFTTYDDELDYVKSMYYKIANKKLKKFKSKMPLELDMKYMNVLVSERPIREPMGLYVLKDCSKYNELSLENIDDEELFYKLEDYKPVYLIENDFYNYMRSDTAKDFTVLTPFYKSNITIMEHNNEPLRYTNKMETKFLYEPTNKIFRYIIDLFMENKYEQIINERLMDNYMAFRGNIDDFFMLPVIIWILEECIMFVEHDGLYNHF